MNDKRIGMTIAIICLGAMCVMEYFGHPVPTTIGILGGFALRHIVGDNGNGNDNDKPKNANNAAPAGATIAA